MHEGLRKQNKVGSNFARLPKDDFTEDGSTACWPLPEDLPWGENHHFVSTDEVPHTGTLSTDTVTFDLYRSFATHSADGKYEIQISDHPPCPVTQLRVQFSQALCPTPKPHQAACVLIYPLCPPFLSLDSFRCSGDRWPLIGPHLSTVSTGARFHIAGLLLGQEGGDIKTIN